MPVDVFPEFAPPRVEIQTSALGLSAAEVEELVTVPLEQALNGIARLDDDPLQVGAAAVARSSCSSSAGTDVLEARQLVAGADGDGHADAADLGGAARHAAAALDDEPGHEDRPVVGHDRR